MYSTIEIQRQIFQSELEEQEPESLEEEELELEQSELEELQSLEELVMTSEIVRHQFETGSSVT